MHPRLHQILFCSWPVEIKQIHANPLSWSTFHRPSGTCDDGFSFSEMVLLPKIPVLQFPIYWCHWCLATKLTHPTWTWLATPVRNQGEARPGCAGTPLYLIWTIQEINGAPYSHYIHLYHIFIFIYPIKLGLLLDISDKLGPIHTISLWLYQSIIIII